MFESEAGLRSDATHAQDARWSEKTYGITSSNNSKKITFAYFT